MTARVACILVNYRSPLEMLERCLNSIFDTAGDVPVRVILIDNASGDGVLEQAVERFPQLVTIRMPDNPGFAAAVNRGLAEAVEPYVLMLNTDAVLKPGALSLMIEALEAEPPDCAGVAPKMMSSSHEGIIDAIGTVMPRNGASYNRGIGQCDLGQYDERDEVAGVCFGAALIRRALFEPGSVGPLYEGYFLYFEDSDWCMRALSRGFRLITVPEAQVLHLHSGVTRNETLAFKYRLIELNTLKLVLRNFESPLLTWRIVVARCSRLLARTFIRRKFIVANLSTLAALAVSLPRLLQERRELKAARVSPDEAAFRLAAGEDAYFDTVAYGPHRCLESLIDTYLRLLRRRQDPTHGRVLAVLYDLQAQALSGMAPALAEDQQALLDGQPPCVRTLVASACNQPAES